MKKQVRQYSVEEKSKIVIETIKGELTIAQITSKYGVHATQISNWKKQGLELLVQGFKSKTQSADPNQQELIKNLYEQIGQLSVERDWLKKNLHCLDLKVRCNMIEPNHNKLTIIQQCKLLGISRSSYYYQPTGISEQELKIMAIIDETYTMHPYYGMRRMAKYLQAQGFSVGRKAVRRYYQIMGLEAVYPKMNLSKRNQAHKIYPYLLKDLEVTYSNQVWCSDITYIRLQQGFVYLVAIMDWHSRYILSWRVSISLESTFCVEALEEAIEQYGIPKIFNTDQGVQFTSEQFICILKKYNIQISMDGKGRVLDNVFIERFWRSLKQEKIYRIILTIVKEAKAAIKEYIDFYNHERMHQALGYRTPSLMYYKQKVA
ncbi:MULTISPECIES: IS3 family transposase [unclassified Candidatus Tisiphia]|uniref:IS3 family transposase n=1 Tax=unclassified Candidatus Tisiphia TaxID=2996318 RepID=UPI00312C9252